MLKQVLVDVNIFNEKTEIYLKSYLILFEI